MGWPWRKQCLRGCDIGDHCNAQEGRGTLGMQYPGKRCNTLGRDAILAGDEAALPAQGNVVSKGIAVSWGDAVPPSYAWQDLAMDLWGFHVPGMQESQCWSWKMLVPTQTSKLDNKL